MGSSKFARLKSVALLVKNDSRLGKANQKRICERLEHQDWMPFDWVLVREMLSQDSRWLLDSEALDE
jgi:hypothetical protein